MKVIKTLAVLLSGFIGGAFCASWLLWPVGDAVKVHVSNASNLDISTIEIAHDDGTITSNTLESGGSKVIPLHVNGESSYSIVVTFDNGKVVSGGGGYVEPGYRVSETITEEKIQHKFESFY